MPKQVPINKALRAITQEELESYAIPENVEFFGWAAERQGRCVVHCDGDFFFDGDIDEVTVQAWLAGLGGKTDASIVTLSVHGDCHVTGDIFTADWCGGLSSNNLGFCLFVLGSLEARNVVVGGDFCGVLVGGPTYIEHGLFICREGRASEFRGPLQAQTVFNDEMVGAPVHYNPTTATTVVGKAEDLPPELQDAFRDDDLGTLYHALNGCGPTSSHIIQSPSEESIAPLAQDQPIVFEQRQGFTQLAQDAQQALDQGRSEQAIEAFEGALKLLPTDPQANAKLAGLLFGHARQRALLLAHTAVEHATDVDRLIREAALALVDLDTLDTPASSTPCDAEVTFRLGMERFGNADFDGAATSWIECLQRSRSYKDDGARRALIHMFSWLGYKHPISQTYRRKLMILL